MKSYLKTGYWTAVIAAGFLFIGATSAQAQFRTINTGGSNQQSAGNGNANLYRSNFSRPVRRPLQTMRFNNNGVGNGNFQGLNQQGLNPYAMPPYGTNPYGMNPYGTNPYGMNPMMNQGGYPGYNPGMMYPGFYPY